jgi:hypothetical protein
MFELREMEWVNGKVCSFNRAAGKAGPQVSEQILTVCNQTK